MPKITPGHPQWDEFARKIITGLNILRRQIREKPDSADSFRTQAADLEKTLEGVRRLEDAIEGGLPAALVPEYQSLAGHATIIIEDSEHSADAWEKLHATGVKNESSEVKDVKDEPEVVEIERGNLKRTHDNLDTLPSDTDASVKDEVPSTAADLRALAARVYFFINLMQRAPVANPDDTGLFFKPVDVTNNLTSFGFDLLRFSELLSSQGTPALEVTRFLEPLPKRAHLVDQADRCLVLLKEMQKIVSGSEHGTNVKKLMAIAQFNIGKSMQELLFAAAYFPASEFRSTEPQQKRAKVVN